MSPPRIAVLVAWAALCSVWALLAWRNKRVATSVSTRFMSGHVLLMGSAFVLVLSHRRFLTQRVLPTNVGIAWLGVGLVCLGVAVAIWARLYLGTNWSGTPTIKVEHELVRSGPYALSRHPIYSGMWMG